MTARYTIFGSPELGGYVVFDRRIGEAVNPLDIDRPQMPLSRLRYYERKEDAETAAERMNQAYERATSDD